MAMDVVDYEIKGAEMQYVEVELDTSPAQDPGPVRRAILLSRNNFLYCYERVLDGTIGEERQSNPFLA